LDVVGSWLLARIGHLALGEITLRELNEAEAVARVQALHA